MAVSVELAVGDAPFSVCANDGCVIEEEPPSNAGVVDNINSPNTKVIKLMPNLDFNNILSFHEVA
jgi:hypothetical protein